MILNKKNLETIKKKTNDFIDSLIELFDQLNEAHIKYFTNADCNINPYDIECDPPTISLKTTEGEDITIYIKSFTNGKFHLTVDRETEREFKSNSGIFTTAEVVDFIKNLKIKRNSKEDK